MALVSGNGDAGNAAVEEPPMHIESPYRPDPVPPAGFVLRTRPFRRDGAPRAGGGGRGQLSRIRRTIAST